jgi:hypothetical protein
MREIRTSGSTRGREVADQSVAPRPTLPAKLSFRPKWCELILIPPDQDVRDSIRAVPHASQPPLVPP